MDKNNLKKGLKQVSLYAGSALLVTSLVAGAGFIVHDNFDHTKEICPLVNILSTPVSLPSGEKEGFTYGVMHQMKEIQAEYREEGIKVIPSFDGNYQSIAMEERIYAIKRIMEDGTVVYTVPDGYTLEVIDGKYYGIKRKLGEPGRAIIINYFDEQSENLNGCARTLRLD